MTKDLPKIQFVHCGSTVHLTDLSLFRNKGYTLPHQYVSWCLHSHPETWRWCRVVDDQGHLLTGFAFRIEKSQAMVGAKIARVERFGRSLHYQPGLDPGDLLKQCLKLIPRLIRFSIEIFDEDETRRLALSQNIKAAGATPPPFLRQYTQTLFVDLKESDEVLMASFSKNTRRDISAVQRRGGSIKMIDQPNYLSRMKDLLAGSFQKTGATIPPNVDLEAVYRDAQGGKNSLLKGVFLPQRTPPRDLVAFVWARLHGDLVTYDLGASERSEDIGNTPLAHALMWEMFQWARLRGASVVDLGGITPIETSPDHPTQGISAFKRRFSTDQRTVGAEFWFEPNNLLGQMAKGSRWLARRMGY